MGFLISIAEPVKFKNSLRNLNENIQLMKDWAELKEKGKK
jgi:hypothetical protein